MSDNTLPSSGASAFLADVVDRGGVKGRTVDVRQHEDGSWDVVLLLDGGYSDRAGAEASLQVEIENVARAYIAEVEAGRIQPAATVDLAKIGLRPSQQTAPPLAD